MRIRTPLTNYNVVFWNCNGKDSESVFQDCLSEITRENDVKIIALCECKDSSSTILNSLQKINSSFSCVGESESMEKIGCIRVFTCLPSKAFSTERKSKRFLSYSFYSKFDLCFVHLKSILSITEESKTMEDFSVLEDIKKQDKAKLLTTKKFIIGDFNSTPYSNSLVNTRLFNSVRYAEAKRSCHRKEHYAYDIYINPSWELLGQKGAHIYGTIHNSTSEYYNLGTYLFDQVIFNRDLINNYDVNSLKIIQSTSNHKLVSSQGKISESYSDHLPIFFTIRG